MQLIGHTAYVPVGAHQQNTSLSSAITLTTSAGTSGVVVQAISQNIRMIIGGIVAPTATLGFQLRAGDPAIFVPVQPGTVLRFIQETASATLQYQEVARFSENVS